MTLTVVSHPSRESPDSMLAVLDALRERVASGEIVAFATAAITDQDETYAFTACQKHVSTLRTFGAVSHLLHCLQAGEV